MPPDDFLPSLREFCDEHDLLLIADEVQTGLGRTGKFWGVENWNVTPDIICIAKTIGGGIPASMVAYREDLVKELPRGFHLGTSAETRWRSPWERRSSRSSGRSIGSPWPPAGASRSAPGSEITPERTPPSATCAERGS